MSENSSAAATFGPTHIIEPVKAHTHTAILLHGRGSNGQEFAQELFGETKLSDQTSLAEKLPSWRWVFPSSPELWSTAFQEEMPAWFEAHSLTDIAARQDLQIPGIKESIIYIKTIVNKEIENLDGDSTKVVLGGISQGGAVGMWTFLCLNHPDKQLGAFFGTNTWLPFASNIERHFHQGQSLAAPNEGEHDESDVFVADMLKESLAQPREAFLQTPIFLGHGTDDAYVDVQLGRQAQHVLTGIGFAVEWKEYLGAELEGHWIKSPEEVDDLLEFFVKHVEHSCIA
ncbi:hypothetical protein F53441_833 [Fusarium austroafricanum]|uniref:Phospholipase/carboxylesterase/thioesterase domain-containing protein n=1 Tax=Fusarium austroafricanum TaxID=2364996 RepID=A0A8H4KWY1_9HYPO|nr:hypothetical protein F53441_833 [Fusarium austroafricanum]